LQVTYSSLTTFFPFGLRAARRVLAVAAARPKPSTGEQAGDQVEKAIPGGILR
jgi:hypothetical protein